MRCFYYDKIERWQATDIVDGILQAVKALEDVQFFVAYATKLLPSDPLLATGETVWRSLLDLQTSLNADRERSITLLSDSLRSAYPEQELDVIRATAGKSFSYYYSK